MKHELLNKFSSRKYSSRIGIFFRAFEGKAMRIHGFVCLIWWRQHCTSHWGRLAIIIIQWTSIVPWVPEATRLLNPAGQRPAKRAWGPKWAERAKGRTRVASGGEPQRSRYVRYKFCTWSLIGYLKTCFFQRTQLVKTGHVKWTGFFSKTEWCLVEKKCVQQRDFIEGENLYSVSFKIWENYNT